MSVDRGVTHVALPVHDLDVSLGFYEQFAGLRPVHQRTDPDTGTRVAWISDLTRPFVVVLIQVANVDGCLGGTYCHLGLAVNAREDVDRLCAQARAEQRPVLGPFDDGPPVGYWAYVVDPDGHNLELSYGQEVGVAVDDRARRA